MWHPRMFGHVAVSTALIAGGLFASGGRAYGAAAPPPQPQVTKLDIDVVAAVLYDSNVADSSALLAQQRGLKLSDESFRPSLAFNLGHRLGRQTVYLQGSVGYDFYRVNHVLNRERIDIHPGVLGQIGLCSGNLSGDYTRQQTELADLALLDQTNALSVVKNTEETKKLLLSASCGKNIGFFPTSEISETWTSNSSSRLQFADSRTFSGTAGLAYQWRSAGRTSLFTNYVRADFPNRRPLVFGSSLNDGYDVISGGASYERRIGARLDGTFSISYTSLTPRSAGSPGFKGLTYSADASYQIGSRLLAKLTFARATLPSSRVGATFSINKTLSGELDYKVSPRLNLSVGGTYEHRSYPNSQGSASNDLTEESVNSEFGRATYRFNRRISLALDLTHTRREANFTPLNYSSTRVGLTVRSSF